MNLELRHLRSLVAVGASTTFTGAAAELGVSQPTLSRTIAQLEEIVGCRLVERTTRRVALTPDGRTLLLDARAVISRLDRAVKSLASGQLAELRLGWTWAAFGAQTAPLISAWRRSTSMELSIVRSSDLFVDLDTGDLDAVICRTVLPEEVDLGRYESAHLHTESLVAAVSVDGALASHGAVSLAELAHERVALGSTAPTATLSLWEGQGAVPVTLEVDTVDEWLTRITLQEIVGITSLTSSYSFPHPEIRYLPIADAPMVEVSLAWLRNDPHPQVEAFASFARRHFRNLQVKQRAELSDGR